MPKEKEEPFFGPKLSFLGSPIFQASVLALCIALMAYQDYSIDGALNGMSIYLGAPVGAGIANWLLKRKEGRPFWLCFLEWSSLTAFIMALF